MAAAGDRQAPVPAIDVRHIATVAARDPLAGTYAALAFLLPWTPFFAPRISTVLVPVAAAAAIGFAVRDGTAAKKLWHPAWAFVVTLILLAAASTFWSPDPAFAWDRVIKIALLLPPGAALFLLARGLEPDRGRAVAMALVAGFGLALALLALHLATEGGVYAMLNPGKDLFTLVNGSNRPSAIMALLAGAVFLSVRAIAPERAAWGVPVLALMLFAPASSQTVTVATIVWCLVYAVAAVLPRFSLYAVALGGAALLLAEPFLFIALQQCLDADRAIDWAAASAGARLDIWYAVSHHALQAPLLGHGIEAARYITDWSVDLAYMPSSSFHHPHNAGLQIWLEFGAVGAGLAATGWALLALQIGSAPAAARPALIAAAAAFLFVTSVSYGIWQSWWITVLPAIGALYVLVSNAGTAPARA